jgi:hypothetical protein
MAENIRQKTAMLLASIFELKNLLPSKTALRAGFISTAKQFFSRKRAATAPGPLHLIFPHTIWPDKFLAL